MKYMQHIYSKTEEKYMCFYPNNIISPDLATNKNRVIFMDTANIDWLSFMELRPLSHTVSKRLSSSGSSNIFWFFHNGPHGTYVELSSSI